MTILDRIKNILAQKGMSLAELERRADLGNGTISRWNKSLPSVDKIQRVAKILGVSIEFLIDGKEESEISERSKILARNAESLSDEQIALIEAMIEQFKKE